MRDDGCPNKNMLFGILTSLVMVILGGSLTRWIIFPTSLICLPIYLKILVILVTLIGGSLLLLLFLTLLLLLLLLLLSLLVLLLLFIVIIKLIPWLMKPGCSKLHSQGFSNNPYPGPNQHYSFY